MEDQYLNKERPIDKWWEVLDKVEEYNWDYGLFDSGGEKQGKVVLLMHERAFRYAKNNGNTYFNQLYYLIKSLKKKGYTFSTMRKY